MVKRVLCLHRRYVVPFKSQIGGNAVQYRVLDLVAVVVRFTTCEGYAAFLSANHSDNSSQAFRDAVEVNFGRRVATARFTPVTGPFASRADDARTIKPGLQRILGN